MDEKKAVRDAYKNRPKNLQIVQPRMDTGTVESLLAPPTALVAKASGRVCGLGSDPELKGIENSTVEHWIPPPAYRAMQGENELVKEPLLQLHALHMTIPQQREASSERIKDLHALLAAAQAQLPPSINTVPQFETPLPSIWSLIQAAIDFEANGHLPPLGNEDPVETEAALNDLLVVIARECPDDTRQLETLQPTVSRREPDGIVIDDEEPIAPICPQETGEINEELEQLIDCRKSKQQRLK